MWKTISSFLNANTVAKFMILGSNYLKTIQAILSPDQIPIEFKGFAGNLGSCPLDLEFAEYVDTLNREFIDEVDATDGSAINTVSENYKKKSSRNL